MAEKKTKREHFAELRVLAAGNAELIAFIDHEVELLNKKNSAERKPTINQMDNAKIKKIIADNIGDKSYTITEMIKAILGGTEWADITCSRLTAVCTQMVESGMLVREVVKRKAYYRKAQRLNLPVELRRVEYSQYINSPTKTGEKTIKSNMLRFS